MSLKIERERRHHAALDALAAKCGERTQAAESHLGCAYCTYLADYYERQRLAANGVHRCA